MCSMNTAHRHNVQEVLLACRVSAHLPCHGDVTVSSMSYEMSHCITKVHWLHPASQKHLRLASLLR